MITFLVGNVSFNTSKESLSMHQCYFSLLDTTKDIIFIDRDPTHFRHILNYLRGSPSFPYKLNHLFELKNEADFYSLHGFCELIDQEVRVLENNNIATHLKLIADRIH